MASATLDPVSEQENETKTPAKRKPAARKKAAASSKKTSATAKNGKPKAPKRRYKQWQRDMVRREYETCTTPEEKLDLCRRAGIADIRRLYNLACQEKITRRSDDLTDAEFAAYTNGDKSIMSQRRSYTPEEEDEILRRRDDPRTTKLTANDEKYLIENYGKVDIVTIAKHRGISETALMYFARKLEKEVKTERPDPEDSKKKIVTFHKEFLRRPAHGYTLKRVSAWLGLTEDELRELASTVNVIIRPLPNKRGEITDYWVLAESLVPFLQKHGKFLIKEKGADLFFIKEVLETSQEVEAGSTTYTGCYFADHGHKCRNPFAGPRYETFCPNGRDQKCKVKELRF